MGNTGIRKLFFAGDYSETHFKNIYEIDVLDLNKEYIKLDKYKNKICLITNVAQNSKYSQQQIEKLKELKLKYKDELEILAFPCNQFRNEDGDFQQIKKYYQEQMQINFPIFAKLDVNGKYTDYIYRYLKRNSSLFDQKLMTTNKIQNDYSKFLVDRNGKVINYYHQEQNFESIEKDIKKCLS